MLEAFKDALRTAFSQKLTYIALVAVPTIVGLFGLLYVFTFTDPIGNFADVPVALVNLDEGATVGGESKNYGAELAESLEVNDNARWVPEDASMVDSGLETTDYYLAVIVPADFSRRVAAGETAAPDQAGIVFYRNMRKNYMLGTLATRIESKLSQEINEKVSAHYAEALAEGLEGARDGLSEAAGAAGDEYDLVLHGDSPFKRPEKTGMLASL